MAAKRTPHEPAPVAKRTGERELELARAAYAERRWCDAVEGFLRADAATPLAASDLGLLALATGLSGRVEDHVARAERAYGAYQELGDCAAAAQWAFWIGFRVFLSDPARAGGWFSRAQRIVDREQLDTPVKGYLLLPAAERHLAHGELEAGLHAIEAAVELGERLGDVDLAALARLWQGRVLVRQGKPEGLALFDEIMLAATAGELSPIVTGLVYCGAIHTCQGMFAFDRVREYTSALSGWCATQPQLGGFAGMCLVIRAEVRQLEGAFAEAIEEARLATARISRSSEPMVFADAFYQKAEIHRLRGEFDAAEEGYRDAHRSGRDPQPGLALLRLAQGRADDATAAIRCACAAVTGWTDRARLLPAFVEIFAAAGDLAEAERGSAELEAIAASADVEVLSAMAAHARGVVRLTGGDAAGALAPLRQAFGGWQRVGAPYIAARIRVSIARACRALGDEEGASLELDAAREVFERAGASPDVALVDGLAKPAGAARAGEHGLTARELEVLRLVARGLTNKAIASELFLSEKTVDRHVSNIFGKVNVSSRAAATAFAYEKHLI